ncbi:hypothetical protein BKA62DRAFT_622604 [Auriculariales sp. MPI-PUGE-AT-0066]|nr:hypothetical protein BKA62DRAFT_622604 [Auriculariales sp. MPI-PUGE-AT-0066]
MATSASLVQPSSVRTGSQSPIIVPEMHLGSLQDLQLTDFTQQSSQRQLSPMAYGGQLSGSPPETLQPSGQGADIASLVDAPNTTQYMPSEARSPSSPTHQRYASLPPGAAPPAPSGFIPTPAPSGSPSSPPPSQRRSLPDAEKQTLQQQSPISPSSGPVNGILPTPPASHSQGGPRHPSAAQQATQTAGTPNPNARPRQSFVQAPTYPSITPLPVSLQGLIASESPLQSTSPPPPNTSAGQQTLPLPRKLPQEEVCVECMMRDRDMADVDVTSPGVWTRPSDADYDDLVRREREEELAETGTMTTTERRSVAGHSSSSGHVSNSRLPRGIRSRGGRLTEENVRKWILMNPKDHEARWRTITKYVKAQSILLEQEMRARARNESEARVAADQARDRYAALRRSTGGEPIVVEPGTGLRGVRVPMTPTSAQLQTQGYFDQQHERDFETQSIPASPGRLLGRSPSAVQDERDVVLLENGLMLERVDLRRDTSGRARSVSLDKRIGGGNGADDRMSTYSTPMPIMPRYPSPPIPESASTRSGRPLPRGHNQNADRRSLFGGFRTSLAGSMISLSASRASVVNLHGQNWEHDRMPGRAISPSMPTLASQQQQWPGIETMPNTQMSMAESVGSANGGKKKKRGGIGKLFGVFTKKDKNSDKGERGFGQDQYAPQHSAVQPPPDDLNTPLAPPPPLTYLMSRKSGEAGSGQPQSGQPHQRQPSNSSLLNVSGTQGPSPPTAPSSVLPSPTSNRFSWRQSNASLDILPSMQTQHQYASASVPSQSQSHLASNPGSFKDSGVEFPNNGHMFGNGKHLDSLPEIQTPPPTLRQRHDTMGSINARPHTVFMTDKSLPPLPPEAFGGNSPHHIAQAPRPGTAPGFRTERSASFSGKLEQPIYSPQSYSPNQPVFHGRSATEFGAQETTGKRRSKFGLSTFLGVGKRKSNTHLRIDSQSSAIERDLSGVVQDPQFVAYRYPSNDGQQYGGPQQQYGMQATTLPVGARR